MKKFFFFLLFLPVQNKLIAQDSFELKGNINIQSGIILLLPVGEESFYPPGHGYYQTHITNGKFTFLGAEKYPTAYRVHVKNDSSIIYMSDLIIIDKGTQLITCNVDSVWEIPAIGNKSMYELQNLYAKAFIPFKAAFYEFNKKSDSIRKAFGNNIPETGLLQLSLERKELANSEQNILLKYTEQHPESFVALWKLIQNLSTAYDRIYDTIYQTFSDSLKNSYTGVMLAKQLKLAQTVAIGHSFPALTLKNIQGSTTKIPALNGNVQYTLIDFWFSHCNPCISQFPLLKQIYSAYKNKGFSIIAISTDSRENIAQWKSVIEKFKLEWNQCLDQDGYRSKKLLVNKFPSNFLIDVRGKLLLKI